MSEYQEQANEFCNRHGVTMDAIYLGHYPRLGEHFTAQWRITLKREGKEYRFDYTGSINDSWKWRETGRAKWQKGVPPRYPFPTSAKGRYNSRYEVLPVTTNTPTAYDVLACLTKYDPGTFENFCAEYGYDTDSRKALETYLAVQKEWQGVARLFGDCLDEYAEII